MRKILVSLAAMLLLTGTPLLSGGPVSASGFHYGYRHRDGSYDRDWYRHHWHRHRHRAYRVCHTRYRAVIVWRHHSRFLIRIPAGRRCHWSHRGDWGKD